MKLRIEIDGNLEETEIVIKTLTLTDEKLHLQWLFCKSQAPRLTFYKGTGEYYLDLSEILFSLKQRRARSTLITRMKHEVRLKLYELESLSCLDFIIVSKSTRSQTSVIYSVDKSFSGTGTISFYQTHKEVHVSHGYQSLLIENF